MPTMPASTGASAGWNGNDASRPRTKNTISPTPAPTASAAISVRPAGCLSAPSGCRISSFNAASPGSLSDATTSTTRATCTSGPLHLDSVDDADDGGIDGAVFQARGHASGAAAHDEHDFADAGIHRVDGHEIIALRLAVRIHAAGHEQLRALQARILPRGDNRPDDSGEEHGP